MAAEGESLGKSRLDLEANLDEFRRNMKEGKQLSGGMNDSLKALAAVADIAENALGDVKMSSTAAAESERIAARIERSVGRDGRAAMEATQHLQEVKLTAAQAAESEAAGRVIEDNLDGINRKAKETRRALLSVKLAGGRTGVGVGPFGSGFGRVGLLGTAIGAGVLTAPGAAPGALGLLAGVPTLAAGAAGAIGALVLAFQGMGKAIGGDLKAYQEIEPAQQKFVMTVRSMIPWIGRLKQQAGGALFPGLTAGLQAALSPGTVSAISTAVVGFAKAIGQAGQAWGQYFGSAKFQQIFGPLMESAARNFTVLSTAALRLFDALGVVGRAAIPLVNWLNDITLKGAALADTWLRAQDASGGLARGMQSAQQSLAIVGRLFGSLINVVIALGRALYPISMVVLPALTSGFNQLAGFINRNRQTISLFGVAVTKDIIATISGAITVIGKIGDAINAVFGPTGVRVAIIATAGALGLLIAPWATIAAAAILATGEIIRHWTEVKGFFVNFAQFVENVFSSMWTGIKGIFNLGVYAVLLNIEALSKGLSAALGWVPGLGGKIKAALSQVDGFIEDFRRRGTAELAQAGADMGGAWGSAFATSVQSAIDAVNKQGVMKTVPMEGTLSGTQHYTKPKPLTPGTHDWYMKYLGYDPMTLKSSAASGVFGTAPAFDKNVPKAKKKQPPLLPPGAQHALDLASANANRASNATGKAVETYLDREISDLEVAAKLIRQKYEGATGRVRTQLFSALTGVLNKIRTARTQLREAIYNDKLADFQFALDLAQLAIDNAKEGSAAYLKAEHQEEKLLRAEIAYLDKRVRNKKLSLALREDALQAEIAAKEQLNALIGQTSTSTKGANEAQFLSSFQTIVHDYAPNAFPDQTSTKPLETKGYETVTELRGIRRILQRIEDGESFPASGYATASAQAAFG